MKKSFAISLLCACFLSLRPDISFASIIINEIAWMGTANSANDEWIELFNSDARDVSLEGWTLKSSDGKLKINLQGTVPQQGFFILERTDDQTLPDIAANLVYKGALSNSGETLILTDANGTIADRIDCQDGWPGGDNKTKQTMERLKNSWQTSKEAGGTPKATNSQGMPEPDPSPTTTETAYAPELPKSSSLETPPKAADTQSMKPTAVVYPKNIFFNEILPSPEGPDEQNEWLEIFNANDFAVNLAGWQIKDTAGAVKTYVLPDNSLVAANGFLVISRPESKITLQNNGDGLELYNPDKELVHRIAFPTAPNNQSYNRNPEKPDDWAWSGFLTPGAGNKMPDGLKQTDSAAAQQENTSSRAVALAGAVPAMAQAGSFAPKLPRLLTFITGVIIAAGSALMVLFLKKRKQE
ncbi:MAG: lamin tail domain-containing protein [Candidatus Pacebacteria bacterium]|nr:lamin tail domain-containing protein [Candidatus Paceibacterota bacterium]